MDHEAILARMHEALASISHPRFFQNERGFQGELRAKLEVLRLAELLPKGSIVELEHQKTLLAHRMTIRPDLIIHEPFDEACHSDRTQGNIAVVELKPNASEAEASGDFESLGRMLDVLRYPVGIFINIGSNRTHATLVPAALRGRIVCFRLAARRADSGETGEDSWVCPSN